LRSTSGELNGQTSVTPNPSDKDTEAPFSQEFVKEALEDSIRWIIWYLRRLVQTGELYSKELTKRYHVSQPQLSCLLVL
jgi:hypothetical protein